MERNNVILLLLVALNITLRIPATSHEIGVDSFYIHLYADSISKYGYAKWVINPLSFFGLYPFSKASAVPYILSITSQVSGLETEPAIYFISLFFGLFGVATSYVMAKELYDNHYFKLFTVFLFSTSPLVLKFTSWSIQPRGLFFMLMPLFIWSITRLRKENKHRLKYLSVAFTLFLILAGIHKIFILMLPIIATFVISHLLLKYVPSNRLSLNPYAIALSFILLFVIQYAYIHNFWVLWYVPLTLNTEWYSLMFAMLIMLVARLGILFPLSLIGLGFIIWEKEKTFWQYSILLTVLSFTPFLAWGPYFFETLIPFFSLLGGYGLLRIWENEERIKRLSHVSSLTIIIVTITIFFSIMTLFERYSSEGATGFEKFMDDRVYQTGRYMTETGLDGIVSTGSDEILAWRLGSASGKLTLPTEIVMYLGYGLFEDDEILIRQTPLPPTLYGLFVFVKFPLNGTLSNKLFNVDYLVSGNDEILHVSALGNKIYDNGLLGVWDASTQKEKPTIAINYTLQYE